MNSENASQELHHLSIQSLSWYSIIKIDYVENTMKSKFFFSFDHKKTQQKNSSRQLKTTMSSIVFFRSGLRKNCSNGTSNIAQCVQIDRLPSSFRQKFYRKVLKRKWIVLYVIWDVLDPLDCILWKRACLGSPSIKT